MIQETVRAYTRGWYAETVTALPRIAAGRMHAPEGYGLGTEPRPELLRSDAVTRRRSGH
jgi:L-alanine-DL-glutamate epimerase-like enolase superfamily enzyme